MQNTSRKYIIISIFFFITNFLGSQNWVWVKGSNTFTQWGKYGTQGIPSVNNTPGAREYGATWTDTLGNLWLFGGIGRDSLGAQGFLNDLWKFDISIKQWVWIKGSPIKNPNPKYGYQGISSTSNTPGGMTANVTWVDLNGDLWLLGGSGIDSVNSAQVLNELWKYTISTNEWTWMKGSKIGGQLSIYGTQTIPNNSNCPGGRNLSVGWTDNNGNLWLFGGSGYAASATNGWLNDLWKYNPLTNQWTWMKGSSTINPAGNWGTLGNFAATNTPSSRLIGHTWTDNSGFLWMYGGSGYDSNYWTGTLSDLWKYDPAINQWMWVDGSSLRNIQPVFGSQNVLAASNQPGAMEGGCSWKDSLGNFYIGYGVSVNAVGTGLKPNFVWKYNPSTNQWVWIKGVNQVADQAGNYGTINVPASSNIPGGRYIHSYWSGKNGNLWMFGGFGFIGSLASQSYMNDLWCLNLCFASATFTNTTPVANLKICSGSNSTLTAIGSGSIQWYDIYGNFLGSGNNLATPTLTNTSTFLIGDNTSCLYTSVTVTVNPNPTVNISPGFTTICLSNTINLVASGANTYTWNIGSNSNVISVSPTVTTSYTVTGTTASTGCKNNTVTTVSVNPNPTINISASSTLVCSGQSLTISGSGASTYTLYPGNTTGSTQTVNPTSSTTYTMLGKSSVCTDTKTIGVTVNPNPTVTAVSSATNICSGQTVTFSPTGASNYTLFPGPVTGSVFVVSPAVNSTYTINGSNSFNCQNSKTVGVIVNPNPTVSVSTSGSLICSGQSATLSASGANSYTWNTSSTSSSIIVTPSINTTYSVTGSNSSGCSYLCIYTQSVSSCTGVESFVSAPDNILSVIPNPSDGEFTIISSVNIDLMVINEIGQIVKTIRLDEVNDHRNKMNGLSSGVYFIISRKEGVLLRKKIIISN